MWTLRLTAALRVELFRKCRTLEVLILYKETHRVGNLKTKCMVGSLWYYLSDLLPLFQVCQREQPTGSHGANVSWKSQSILNLLASSGSLSLPFSSCNCDSSCGLTFSKTSTKQKSYPRFESKARSARRTSLKKNSALAHVQESLRQLKLVRARYSLRCGCSLLLSPLLSDYPSVYTI